MSRPSLSRNKTEIKMTDFTKKVLALVKQIPMGKVASYGQIAALAGKPGGARGVGWILNSCAKAYGLPWQRVINSKGKISFDSRTKEFHEQRRLLLKEKIHFSADDTIPFDLYGWKKKPRQAKPDKNKPQLFS
jgi:methylated-DNA-protein-cysteine methyltransferase-like protein